MPPRRILTRRDWLSAAGLLALAGCAGQSKEEPIWIGHIAPTGKPTESAINGIRLTLADLRENEVTVGGRSIGVRHVEAEAKARVRAEASRLLAVNRVAALIVGPHVEGIAEVIAIARSHGAIAIVLGGTADAALAGQAVWLGIDPETSGEMLARYAIAKGQKAYSSTLGTENPVRRGFDRVFTRAGGKELSPVMESGRLPLDRVVLEVPNEREDRRRHPFLALRGAGRPEAGIPNAPDREVWKLVMQPESASLPAEGRAWAERYEKRFGKRPGDEAILAADAIALIAAGLQTVGGDDRRKLAENLADRTEIAGLTGPIERKDRRTLRPMWVERVVQGKRVAVEPVPE